MILGIGIDIVEVERIKEGIEKFKDFFLNKILTENEKKYCYKFKKYYIKCANRFTAKEAVSKALGVGIGKVNWKDIEVINDVLGKPEINLYGNAKKIFKEMGGKAIYVSISDTDVYSIAYCIIEG